MKKKIAILGSTGSIGKTLLKIIEKDKKSFDVVLLTANKDHETLINQAKKFNVKNLIITDQKKFKILKQKNIKKNIKIFNTFNNLKKILNKKIDYTMSSIIGINGLIPTCEIIKYSKNIAIANKESIICGWNIIKKELKKNNTNFIPVDSEHFSLWYALQNLNYNTIEKIYLTASGGPLYNMSLKNYKNVNIKTALNHPNWKMGKKISIDSATMINKVFEVIEAKKIFQIPYNKLSIIIHPKSYVHAIIKLKNGLSKMVIHDTSMKIPIINSLYSTKKIINSKTLNFKILNNLDFRRVNVKKFPLVKVLKMLPDNTSLFETILVSTNDKFVDLFLNRRIKFTDISKKMNKILKLYNLKKYKKIKPKNVEDKRGKC